VPGLSGTASRAASCCPARATSLPTGSPFWLSEAATLSKVAIASGPIRQDGRAAQLLQRTPAECGTMPVISLFVHTDEAAEHLLLPLQHGIAEVIPELAVTLVRPLPSSDGTIGLLQTPLRFSEPGHGVTREQWRAEFVVPIDGRAVAELRILQLLGTQERIGEREHGLRDAGRELRLEANRERLREGVLRRLPVLGVMEGLSDAVPDEKQGCWVIGLSSEHQRFIVQRERHVMLLSRPRQRREAIQAANALGRGQVRLL
jgi:hypothetical protein